MVHGALERQVQVGPRDLPAVRGPPPVESAPEGGHDERAVQSLSQGQRRAHLEGGGREGQRVP
eukprot:623155-Prorocentrum_minimum.AAC.1